MDRPISKTLRRRLICVVSLCFVSRELIAQNEQNDAAFLAKAYERRIDYPESVRASTSPYISPEVQSSDESGVEVELKVAYSEHVIPADPASRLLKDQRVKLRSFNGRTVGPTIRIRPNQKLSIRLKNELPLIDPIDGCDFVPPTGMNDPHGWNCTNLHTHGLHISPEGHADNVFRTVPPGKNAMERYEYQLPRDHVSGTFWYHAHKHGSVALQLTTGMAGALIVEGTGLDLVPEIHDAVERVMVLQQLKFTPKPGVTVTSTPQNVYTNDTSAVSISLINGQLHPVLRVAPGSVERWRFIHAGLNSTLKLAVLKDSEQLIQNPASRVYLPLREIAVDGIPRGKLVEWSKPANNDYPVMYPGYRWDVLFKAPYEPGTYFLVNAPLSATHQLRSGDPATPLQFLARIEVKGATRPMKLPQQADLEAAVPSQFRDITDDEILDESGKPRICALSLQNDSPKKLHGRSMCL